MPDHDAMPISDEVLGILARAHPNVLLIGPRLVTARAVDRLREHLLLPIEAWSPPDARALPEQRRGTLLIPAIDMADDAQQAQLCAWLAARVGLVQVLALSATPLFVRVEQGLFLARLYYRLNQLYVDLAGGQES